MYYNEKHAKVVEQRGDNYQYIGSYRSNEATIDGRNIGKHGRPYVRIKCPYCSEESDIAYDSFKFGAKCSKCCKKYENSFAYHIQMELKESLNKYWDWEKNTVNPYHIYKCSGKFKVWIKCDKRDYHESYEVICKDFHDGSRCPYCNPFASHKIHPKDSFGYLYPEKAKQWSDKNNISPFEVAPKTGNKYWFKCEKCNDEFRKDLHHLNRHDSVKNILCDKCNVKSKLENKCKYIFDKYNVTYESQKIFKNLKGTRNGLLSYDFYLPDYNMLLECQGEQHEHFCKGMHENKSDFKRQQEHDRRKFNYALEHNYIPMEIWYWDYDNIEEILIRELGLH